MKVSRLKRFIAEIPKEFDDAEINWVDFAGCKWLRARLYDDGVIIDESWLGCEEYEDKRPESWA